jgi:hypothetical protein
MLFDFGAVSICGVVSDLFELFNILDFARDCWSGATSQSIRAVVDQPTVLKLGVMTASLPLQDFRPVLHLIAGRTFTNYRQYLGFCHSGLKSRKPFVHLASKEQKSTEGELEQLSCCRSYLGLSPL